MSKLRTVGRIVAVAGVVLAVLTVRAVTGARSELRRGDRLRAQGDWDSAVLAYRRAARWYAPGNPYDVEALGRLADMARKAEREARTERALLAWRAVRGAILSARSFYTPHEEQLERADSRIAAISDTADQRPGLDEQPALEPTTSGRSRPHLAWTLVLLLGWLAWTSGSFVLALRAVDSEDRVRGKVARRWGTVVVVGFGLFVIGMVLA